MLYQNCNLLKFNHLIIHQSIYGPISILSISENEYNVENTCIHVIFLYFFLYFYNIFESNFYRELPAEKILYSTCL